MTEDWYDPRHWSTWFSSHDLKGKHNDTGGLIWPQATGAHDLARSIIKVNTMTLVDWYDPRHWSTRLGLQYYKGKHNDTGGSIWPLDTGAHDLARMIEKVNIMTLVDWYDPRHWSSRLDLHYYKGKHNDRGLIWPLDTGAHDLACSIIKVNTMTLVDWYDL